MKLYVVSGSNDIKNTGFGEYFLISEEGEILYSHISSNINYAISDLILSRPERQKELSKKYGEYQVLLLGEDDMTFDKLFDNCKKFIETHKLKRNDNDFASITIE